MVDPETGEEITYGEWLRRKGVQVVGEARRQSVTVVGDAKRVEMVNEFTGGTAGWHDHHPDGRVSCTVTPDPVRTTAAAQAE